MTIRARHILDLLRRKTLVRLMRERGLPSSRDNDERRKSLAHSYRGDVESLILSLTREELVALFRAMTFDLGRGEVYLSNPGKYHLDELRAFAIRAFAGRRVRVPDEFTPVDDGENDDDDVSDEEVSEAIAFAASLANADVSGDDVGDHEGEDDIAPDDDDDTLPVAEALRVDSEEWSRPRMIGRILRKLGEDEPQRLRTARFRELIETLGKAGIDACLADDPSARVLDASDDSPGIIAKLRLRLQTGATGARQTRSGDRPARTGSGAGSRASDGGPRIVVQAGEKPIPQQVSRPSDYNLAVLRLQFLTAVPSAERGTLSAWPDGYLLSATRGLTLRDQERSLLRAYAAGLCVGNHSPYDAIPRLSQVLSPSDWDALLDDFQALNPFQPELVRVIVDQLAPVTAPRSQPGSWRAPTAEAPPDLAPDDPARASARPLAARGRRADAGDSDPGSDSSNKRDLGALAGMFDDE